MKRELFWVWVDNQWQLARQCQHESAKWQIIRLDTSRSEVWESTIVVGPKAGVISEEPSRKPFYEADNLEEQKEVQQ